MLDFINRSLNFYFFVFGHLTIQSQCNVSLLLCTVISIWNTFFFLMCASRKDQNKDNWYIFSLISLFVSLSLLAISSSQTLWSLKNPFYLYDRTVFVIYPSLTHHLWRPLNGLTKWLKMKRDVISTRVLQKYWLKLKPKWQHSKWEIWSVFERSEDLERMKIKFYIYIRGLNRERKERETRKWVRLIKKIFDYPWFSCHVHMRKMDSFKRKSM